jgi:hypothetical protein
MVQCETRHESIDPKRRKNARYYEGDTSGLNQEQFRLPRLARHFLFGIEQFSPYLLSQDPFFLHSVIRISNLTRRTEYQKRGIRRIFMDHRILLHLEGDCVVKTALSKRVLGVFSGASHILFFFLDIGISFSSFHDLYKLIQIFAFYSATHLLLQFSKSIFGNTSEREWRGWIGWSDG